MRAPSWFAMSRFRGDVPATAVLLVLVGACGESGTPSRDGAVPDSAPTAIESGRIEVDAPSLSDSASDPWQAASETGAMDADALPSDIRTSPDAAIDTMGVGRTPDAAIDRADVGASPDAATDSRDVGLTPLDLGTAGDSSTGSEASVPSGCVGEDLFVDVTDQRNPSASKSLLYPCGSTLPMAYPVLMDRTPEVVICASENPDSSGASLGLRLIPTGQDSGYFDFDGVGWSPSGGSTSMTDHCGGGNSVTITRFDSGGGILEGSFEKVALGYSCEGIDAILSCHFRVCYVPTS